VPGSPFATGVNPQGVCVHSSGQWAYVAHSGVNEVWGYALDSATGVPTPMPGSPFAGGGRGWGVACTTMRALIFSDGFESGDTSAWLPS